MTKNVLKQYAQSNWAMLLFFILISIGLRFFTFFPTVIDHDESTYIVIADALLQGQTYFVDVIDTKPIGIFWIYMTFMSLFGTSIFMLRLAAAVVIGGTCFFLYRAKLKEGSSFNAALASGLIFIILNTIFTYYGVSPNTETYFTFFTALALWLYIKQPNIAMYFLVGLSLGIGFIIKYVVAFDALAFGLFLIWLTINEKRSWINFFIQGFLMVLGFMIPFLLVFYQYMQMGLMEEFLFYSFEVSGRYLDTANLLDYIVYFFDFNLRMIAVVLFAVFAFRSANIDKSIRFFGLGWLCLVWVAILLPGKFFGHYTIQAMIPLSYLAASFFDVPLDGLPKWIRWTRTWPYRWYLLGLILAVVVFFQVQDGLLKKDYPKMIAKELKDELKEGESIYVGNYHQILYHLLKTPCPIPYVHSSLVWRDSHVDALKIDINKVLSQIKQVQPKFIFLKSPREEDALNDIQLFLDERYKIKKTYKEEIFLYELTN